MATHITYVGIMNNMKKVRKVKVRRVSNKGYFVPAGLLIGLGIGLLTGEIFIGLIFGIGAGFLAKAIL